MIPVSIARRVCFRGIGRPNATRGVTHTDPICKEMLGAGLTDRKIIDALFMKGCRNTAETLDSLRAKYDNATICLLPEDPLISLCVD